MEAVDAVPVKARHRALQHLANDEVLPWDLWRMDADVADVRWAAGGLVSNLRGALDTSMREFLSTTDPSVGLASAYVLQALVLAVLDAEHDRA